MSTGSGTHVIDEETLYGMRQALHDSEEDFGVARSILIKAFDIYNTPGSRTADSRLVYNIDTSPGVSFILSITGYPRLSRRMLMSLANCHPRIRDITCDLGTKETQVHVWRSRHLEVTTSTQDTPFTRDFVCKELMRSPDMGALDVDDQKLALRVIGEVYNIHDKMPPTHFRLSESDTSYTLIFATSIAVPLAFITHLIDHHCARLEHVLIDYAASEIHITMGKVAPAPPGAICGGGKMRLVTPLGTSEQRPTKGRPTAVESSSSSGN